ncbi:SDR family NAD(P)-dependent oxidoreductase [Paractinoplanes atraurantiacus]|uniref:NAD(P)-dependent dehydrogenase, short-chain alcohol dehydrogenase family n=1 Tax=Paractinoplanes atraurantiacus TaxID=1036182 RepID=A0A285GJJ5_9ACTN|nr:SDR family NAD(P)-dependent oxidoreductase [Actinoplanes atraurantiacus]SNY23374.1 NAD(P)-dependent dehydrogenase, short-chain alcohol dehydrogenase family [Actinoplanes atraurantiacus]
MTKILVTGSTGIGGAVAAELGERALTIGRHGRIRADLSLLASVAEAADEVAASHDRLDAIVCCAGVFTMRAATTAEGLERAWVLNYLSRFLLIDRLLPLLPPDGRVVLVANAGRYRDTRGNPTWGLGVAGRTQFANDLYAVELASRHPSLSVACVYPGLVATGVFRDAYGVPAPLRWVMNALQQRIGASPASAARGPVQLAIGPRFASGFYGPSARPLSIPARVRDGRRAELWAESEAVTTRVRSQTCRRSRPATGSA